MTPSEDPDPPSEATADQDRLPDDAVVVRFGLSAPDVLHKTALAHHDKRGDFAISVASLPDRSADELARLGALRHPRIRETTVGRIREVGYDVVPDEPPEGHALIMLARHPADDDYETISNAFDDPRPNPVIEEEVR